MFPQGFSPEGNRDAPRRGRARRDSAAVGRDFSVSQREHRATISAIRAGTADRVERAIRVNWSNSATRLSAGLASMALSAFDDYRSSDLE